MKALMPRWQVILLSLLCEGGLGGLAWLLGCLFDQPCYEPLHWEERAIAWGAAASGPMLLAFVLCLVWPVGPLERIKRFSREFIRPLFAPCTVLDLAFISLLAGLGEELLFRGVLQAVFSRAIGLEAGLAAASVLFGLVHPFTPGDVVLAGLMGAYLGEVWLLSGNLLVPVVAHALYDFLLLIVLVKGPERVVGLSARLPEARGETGSVQD